MAIYSNYSYGNGNSYSYGNSSTGSAGSMGSVGSANTSSAGSVSTPQRNINETPTLAYTTNAPSTRNVTGTGYASSACSAGFWNPTLTGSAGSAGSAGLAEEDKKAENKAEYKRIKKKLEALKDEYLDAVEEKYEKAIKGKKATEMAEDAMVFNAEKEKVKGIISEAMNELNDKKDDVSQLPDNFIKKITEKLNAVINLDNN